jgi:hypothetical protein
MTGFACMKFCTALALLLQARCELVDYDNDHDSGDQLTVGTAATAYATSRGREPRA